MLSFHKFLDWILHTHAHTHIPLSLSSSCSPPFSPFFILCERLMRTAENKRREIALPWVHQPQPHSPAGRDSKRCRSGRQSWWQSAAPFPRWSKGWGENVCRVEGKKRERMTKVCVCESKAKQWERNGHTHTRRPHISPPFFFFGHPGAACANDWGVRGQPLPEAIAPREPSARRALLREFPRLPRTLERALV